MLEWTEFFGGPCGSGTIPTNLVPAALRATDDSCFVLCYDGLEYEVDLYDKVVQPEGVRYSSLSAYLCAGDETID